MMGMYTHRFILRDRFLPNMLLNIFRCTETVVTSLPVENPKQYFPNVAVKNS